MTIKREINGAEIEITLTDDELFEAYKEQKHNFDVDDVLCWLEDNMPNHALDDETIDNIARSVRHLINKYNDDLDTAVKMALSVLENEGNLALNRKE